jgi:hypothetical protein
MDGGKPGHWQLRITISGLYRDRRPRRAFQVEFRLVVSMAQPLPGKACHEPDPLADGLAVGLRHQKLRVSNMMGGIRKIGPPPRSSKAPAAQATSGQSPLKRIRKKDPQVAPPKELPAAVNKST